MKNKLVIAVLVIAVLLIGGGAYLTLSKSQTSAPQSAVKETPKENPGTALGTLKNILTGGKTQSCTIEYPNNMGSGTFYVSDKKFAGEFTIKEQGGKEITGHSVSDGTYVYVWSTAAPTGIKMKLDAVINAPTGSAQTGSVDFSQEVSYKCSPWITDSSKFQLPSNIQFTDVSGLMNQVKPSAGTQTQGTSPCDQITNPQAKAACESALKSQQ